MNIGNMPICKSTSKIPMLGKVHFKTEESIMIMAKYGIVCLFWSYQQEHSDSIWLAGAQSKAGP